MNAFRVLCEMLRNSHEKATQDKILVLLGLAQVEEIGKQINDTLISSSDKCQKERTSEEAMEDASD